MIDKYQLIDTFAAEQCQRILIQFSTYCLWRRVYWNTIFPIIQATDKLKTSNRLGIKFWHSPLTKVPHMRSRKRYLAFKIRHVNYSKYVPVHFNLNGLMNGKFLYNAVGSCCKIVNILTLKFATNIFKVMITFKYSIYI